MLADLAGPDSRYTMHVLQVDTSFFSEDAELWPGDPANQASKIKVLAINVIIDCAERGV